MLTTVLIVFSVAIAILFGLSAIVLLRVGASVLFDRGNRLRVGASVLFDRGNRISSLSRMGFDLRAYWGGRVPREGASSEIGCGHGIGGEYDGEQVQLQPEETISGRIL